MSHLEWVIAGVGGVLGIIVATVAAEIRGRLDRILEELAFANKEKREFEYHERYPNLPR